MLLHERPAAGFPADGGVRPQGGFRRRLGGGVARPWLAVIWLLLAATAVARADEPDLSNQEAPIPEVSARQLGYSIRLWSLEDGLPLDRLHSLAQTSDGYLWIGADSGKLCRFDGTRFTRVPTRENPLAYTQIYGHLLSDRDGGLWLRGRMLPLGRYAGNGFEAVPGAEVLAGDASAGPMIQGNDGSLWIAAANPTRFYHWADGRVEIVSGGNATPPRSVVGFAVSAAGEVWGVWSDGSLFRLTRQGPQDHAWKQGDAGVGEKFAGLMRTASGGLAAFSPSGLFQLVGGRWVEIRRWPSPIPTVRFVQECADGTLWLATHSPGRILCLRGNRLVNVPLSGTKPPVSINHLMEDAVGNVWIATFQGLLQLRPAPFRTWSVAEGLPGPRVVSITAGVDSRVWFRTVGPAVLGRIQPSPDADRLETVPARTDTRFVVPIDADSRWLISRNSGRVSLEKGERVEPVSENLAGGGDPPTIHAVLRTRSGGLWISTLRGLYRWDGQSFAPMTFPDGSRTKHCHYLAEDSEGRVYAGTYNEGVHVFEAETGRLLQGGDPVPGITAIDVAPDDSLWAVSEGSRLARWQDGKWRLLDAGVMPGVEGIVNLRHDRHGGVWLGTESEGLLWVRQDELTAVADGRRSEADFLRFGPDDGLGSLACTGDAAGLVNGPDGRVWVATADGISVVDPERLVKRRRDAHLPAAVIDQALVDDRSVGPGIGPSVDTRPPVLLVPPGSSRVEVRFSAVDLESGDRVRFRYRLKNYADDWETTGTGRTAVFHRVPPGRYVFEVQAANAYGIWNPDGASLAVDVQPLWWQRSSVQAAFALVAFTGMGGAYLARVRAFKRRQAMQESFSRQLINSQEQERKRIAGELHDGLGQELLVIKSRIDLGTAEPRELSNAVGEAIGQVKQISRALRPAMLERAGLARSLAAMVKQVSDATRIPVEVDIGDINDLLSDEAAISIYRLVQEALNNVVAHSDASEASVTVRPVGDAILVEIADDGRGFEAPLVLDGDRSGSGVRAMAERVSLLGGTFHCDTAPGRGTRIRVTVPRSRS